MSDGQDILDQIAAAGRKVLPMHEYMAAHHPSGLGGFNRFLMTSIYESDELETKYKEMVLACACVAAGSSAPVIASHFRKALAAGATRGELLQAIEMTAAVMATRTVGAGVMALREADDDA